MVARVATIIRARANWKVNFGRQHHLVALTTLRQCSADHALAFAAVVAVGSIEEVDPGVERALDHAHRLVRRRWVGEVERSETEWRDAYSCAAKRAIVH